MKTSELISKYRAPLMGIAILWVMLFHTDMVLPFPLSSIKDFGYGGTDIFLFLSGFGLYYSLKKNNDPMEFYKRRFKRIMPTYLPYFSVWFACLAVTKIPEIKSNTLGFIQSFFGNLSFLGRVNGLEHQYNWYIPAIFWFYLLTPIFFGLISNCDKKIKARNVTLLMAFVVFINITFLGNDLVLIGVSRIFVFLLGMIFADAELKETNEKSVIILSFVSLIVGGAMLWYFRANMEKKMFLEYGLDFYPFILVAPSLSILLSKFFSLLDRIKVGKKINSFFGFLGKNSFEIYLVHLFLFTIIESTILSRMNNLLWIAASVASIIISIVYGKIIKIFTKKLSK